MNERHNIPCDEFDSEVQRIGGMPSRCRSKSKSMLPLTLLIAGVLISSTAGAQIRVGPTDPVTGFPLWYEDDTGLRLDLCDHQQACFFAPPDPNAPVTFPGNYPDEAFYWAADAGMDGGPANSGLRANMTLAREAAFFNGPVVDGDQIVFSRIRFFIDGIDSMVGNTYTITHPYGTLSFTSQSGDAGPGVNGPGFSSTIDVGITQAGEFSSALGVFPTFLIASTADRATLINTPGALLDESLGLALTQVQGSPNGTNLFRIEGPNIGDAFPSFQCADPALGGVKDTNGADLLNDCVETDLFAIMGRVASKYGVAIDRATYDKVDIDPASPTINDPISYVNIWASTVEGQTLTARVDGGAEVVMAEGLGGNYFVRLQEGVDYTPLVAGQRKPDSVTVNNITDSPSSSISTEISDHVVITKAEWNTDSDTLEVIAQSSNQMDTSLLDASFEPALTNLTGTWTNGGLGTGSGLYTKIDPNTPDVPPLTVTITSLDGGVIRQNIQVTGALTGSGQTVPLTANAGADKSVQAGTILDLNGADSTGPIAAFDWITTSSLFFSCVTADCSQISVTTPTAAEMADLDKLVAEFTLTVSDVDGNTASDSTLITVTNPNFQPADICTITRAQYDPGKESWRIEGTSDTPDNQRVFAYLGSVAFDIGTSRFIGEARVDAIGDWSIRTARGSAVDNNQVPGASDTVVWIESERGCQTSSNFVGN